MSNHTDLLIQGDGAAFTGKLPRVDSLLRRRRRLVEPLLGACENCEAPLWGEFCAKCGQHAIEYRRSILRVLVDALDSLFNWDTKFLKTVGVLLTRPGKLTGDFNAGRRIRYVHPLRLYLLASIVFFLVAKMANLLPAPTGSEFTGAKSEEIEGALEKLAAPDSTLNAEQRVRVEAVRARLPDLDRRVNEKHRADFRKALRHLPRFGAKKNPKAQDVADLEAALTRIEAVELLPVVAAEEDRPALPAMAAPGPSPGGHSHLIDFHFGGPGTQSEFEKWVNTRIKEKLGEGGTKAQLFFGTVRSHIPTMMLCCVPLFAFVLKLLYVRQRRYYVEHLVYALHIHSFAYIAVIVITLSEMAAIRWFPSLAVVLAVALSLVMVTQVFLSIRRVYQQSWLATTLKLVMGGLIYSTVLALALGATAFITLLLP